MTTTRRTVWYNAEITIENEVINIRDGNNNIWLKLAKVSKMYLSKSKPNYFSAMIGSILLRGSSYYLFIRTKDQEEIKIHIKDFRKQYYVDLISRVRKKIASTSLH